MDGWTWHGTLADETGTVLTERKKYPNVRFYSPSDSDHFFLSPFNCHTRIDSRRIPVFQLPTPGENNTSTCSGSQAWLKLRLISGMESFTCSSQPQRLLATLIDH